MVARGRLRQWQAFRADMEIRPYAVGVGVHDDPGSLRRR